MVKPLKLTAQDKFTISKISAISGQPEAIVKEIFYSLLVAYALEKEMGTPSIAIPYIGNFSLAKSGAEIQMYDPLVDFNDSVDANYESNVSVETKEELRKLFSDRLQITQEQL